METGFAARIHARALQSPDEPAVVFRDRRLSYADFHRLADAIRAAVAARPTGDAPVGVLLPRSPELVAAPVGILWAGAAYVPLPEAEPQRLGRLIRDCSAGLVVTTAERAAEVRACGAEPIVVAELAAGSPADEVVDPPPDALAYVLYTSGSTGDPKGIAMTHGSVRDVVEWQVASTARHLGGEPLRALQFTPITFDVSFLEIFCTLLAGGTIVVPDEDERRDPVRLHDLMAAERVTSAFLAHIALQSMAEVGVRHAKAGGQPLALREVMTGGEQLIVSTPVAEWFATMPGCTLQNIYGPSETHVVTTHDLTGDPAAWPATPPIGRALPTATVLVLDENLAPVPAGEQGELCVTGDCLARGYFGRPDLDVDRFVVNPADGERMYRTGDVVIDLGDGVYQYLGRGDDRVKVRGMVVELGGVEAALARHPDVESCAVLGRSGVNGTRLVAYLVSRALALPPGSEPVTRQAEPELQRFLAGELPEPAVPETFVYLPAMPLGRSDKIDRKALPEPSLARPNLRVPYAPPRTPAERTVAAIWAELLQIEDVGVDDGFFELGGTRCCSFASSRASPRSWRSTCAWWTCSNTRRSASCARSSPTEPPTPNRHRPPSRTPTGRTLGRTPARRPTAEPGSRRGPAAGPAVDRRRE